MNRLPKKNDKMEVTLLPAMRTTCVGTQPKEKFEIDLMRKKHWKDEFYNRSHSKLKDKEEIWYKKRTQARQTRKRMRKSTRNLKTFLFDSVNYDKISEKTVLPSLFEVLETVKDAWPPPRPRKNYLFYRQDNQRPALPTLTRGKMILSKGKMKEEMYLQFPSPLINRRFSMPEELMRKYFIMKEKTSEESRMIKTMDEIMMTTSILCKTTTKKPPNIVQNPEKNSSKSNQEAEPSAAKIVVDVQHPTSSPFESVGEPSERKNGQNGYHNHGKTIIRVKEANGKYIKANASKGNIGKVISSTIPAREETDENGTTESMAFSSTAQLPKQESPSDVLSSESIQCTCRELTSSKTTSTDIFLSGKSTLSQTVSDKSVSTQDSTVSVRSVSTRGSTVTDNCSTTTTEAEKTSAKESTMSENTPRTCRRNWNQIYRREESCCMGEKLCPNILEVQNFQNNQCFNYCPVHHFPANEFYEHRNCCGTDIGRYEKDFCEDCREAAYEPSKDRDEEERDEMYTWAKLTHDELHLMQQLRHQRLFDSQFEMIIDNEIDPSDTMTLEYDETDNLNSQILIPRYSALPRSFSMLVNTSSPDNSSKNSDSDSQSLADSLDDQPITHVHHYHFDTRNESKPVRGDADLAEAKLPRVKVPKGRAFFVNIKDPFGESEQSKGMEKIPRPPERIRNHIDERHLNLNTKHKHSHENLEYRMSQKKKKTKILKEDRVKTEKIRKKEQKHKKENRSSECVRKSLRKEKKFKVVKQDNKSSDSCDVESEKPFKHTEVEETKKIGKRKNENKERRGRFSSKIPVLISSRSNSSLDGEDDYSEPNEKSINNSSFIETTEIMEIPKADKGLSLQIPHQPSSVDTSKQMNKTPLLMPPLLPNLRQQTLLHSPFNRSSFPVQTRRSPVSKYRHRFEVIPEEKSSSLSSTEDRSTIETLPKFANLGTNPLPAKENSSPFETYNLNGISNFTVGQVEEKKVKTLPYLKGHEEQKIIIFSSEPRNSIKGREALIAMNRDDFNRLAKGWMNFYKLKEYGETSDGENLSQKDGKNKNDRNSSKSVKEKETNERAIDGMKTPTKSAGEVIKFNVGEDQKNYNLEKRQNFNNSSLQTIQRHQKTEMISSDGNATNRNRQNDLDENVRFYSSNTILRTIEAKPKTEAKDRSLGTGESSATDTLNPQPLSKAMRTEIDRVERDNEDSDSDSTDYLEPPSPRVPPLLFEDISSEATISSGESDFDDDASPRTAKNLKSPEMHNRESGRQRDLKMRTSRNPNKNDSGWSVTIAGTVELSQSVPDLEMKLSFPVKRKQSVFCRSAEKFGEALISPKLTESFKDSNLEFLPKSLKQERTVIAQNSDQGKGQNYPASLSKSSKNLNKFSSRLESPRNENTGKVLKESPQKKVLIQKLYAIWPKVQQIIREELDADNCRLTGEFFEDETLLLSVRGTAIFLEEKEKPLKMTQRDVTGRYTSREIASRR